MYRAVQPNVPHLHMLNHTMPNLRTVGKGIQAIRLTVSLLSLTLSILRAKYLINEDQIIHQDKWLSNDILNDRFTKDLTIRHRISFHINLQIDHFSKRSIHVHQAIPDQPSIILQYHLIWI